MGCYQQDGVYRVQGEFLASRRLGGHFESPSEADSVSLNKPNLMIEMSVLKHKIVLVSRLVGGHYSGQRQSIFERTSLEATILIIVSIVTDVTYNYRRWRPLSKSLPRLPEKNDIRIVMFVRGIVSTERRLM